MNSATCKAGEKTAIDLIRTSTTPHVGCSKEINSCVGKRWVVRDEAFSRQVGHQLFHDRHDPGFHANNIRLRKKLDDLSEVALVTQPRM